MLAQAEAARRYRTRHYSEHTARTTFNFAILLPLPDVEGRSAWLYHVFWNHGRAHRAHGGPQSTSQLSHDGSPR